MPALVFALLVLLAFREEPQPLTSTAATTSSKIVSRSLSRIQTQYWSPYYEVSLGRQWPRPCAKRSGKRSPAPSRAAKLHVPPRGCRLLMREPAQTAREAGIVVRTMPGRAACVPLKG